MDTPAAPNLRPLRLGELLDQAIRLYRRNFLTFIGIIAMVYVPLMILQTISTTVLTRSLTDVVRASSPQDIFSNYGYWGGMLSTVVVAFLQFIFVQGIATGALTRAVADNHLGKTTGILEAYRGIGRSWATLLGALLVIGILAIVVVLWWVIVPCIGWLTGLGMLVFLTTAVSPMVAPVVVLERPAGVLASIRRAWNLVRRRFWPVLGYIFVLYLFSLIIVGGPSTIINLILTTAMGSFGDPARFAIITTIIQALVSLVASLLYYPLQMTAFTLIYFDLRVRTEGFDIALMTRAATDETGTDQLMAPPPSPNERLITGAELGNFAILTIAAFGLYILAFAFLFFLGGLFMLPTLMR